MLALVRVITTLSLVVSSSSALCQGISVSINGQNVQFRGAQPQEIDGRVMVPVRGVLEHFGSQVKWNPADRTLTASRGGRVIKLTVSTLTADVDGRTVMLNVPATIIAGSVMVPLRFVAESLGAAVTWDTENRLVRVATADPTEAAPVSAPRVPRSFARVRTVPPPQRIPDFSAAPITATLGFIREDAVIPVILDTPIDSKTSKAGDAVSATVETGVHDARLPRGCYFRGMVRFVVPAQVGQSGAVALEFSELVFPDGSRIGVEGSPFPLETRMVVSSRAGYLLTRPNASTGGMMFVRNASGIRLARAEALANGRVRRFVAPAIAGETENGDSDVNLQSGARFGVRLARQISFDPTGLILPDDR